MIRDRTAVPVRFFRILEKNPAEKIRIGLIPLSAGIPPDGETRFSGCRGADPKKAEKSADFLDNGRRGGYIRNDELFYNKTNQNSERVNLRSGVSPLLPCAKNERNGLA